MDKLIVKGGARLTGRVEISGSKNSALPILAATLLTPETCVIHNVPDLSDIRFMVEILRQLGAEVTFENGTVTTRAEKVISEVPYDLVRKMRASICVLGPMVARCGKATISEPGGCSIGDRPIDIHLRGLAELGATSHSAGGQSRREGNFPGQQIRFDGARHRQRHDGGHAGQGPHDHRKRGLRAGSARPGGISQQDGRENHRARHAAD
jgi:UDP-N-acetylglucosamine enolpyruvyl transferase